MISGKGLIRITVVFAIICWLGLLFSDLFLLFAEFNQVNAGITKEIPILFLDLFFVFVFINYRLRVQKAESINFIDLLWRVFSTGLVASLVQMVVGLIFYLLSSNKLLQNPLAINFFYHINLAVIVLFLISTFIVWKRLILYQKNRRLQLFWKFFEYILLASILFNFFQDNAPIWMFRGILGVLFLTGFILSFNLKWIAYLNFKQKWRSILLLALVLLYLWYFINNLFTFSQEFDLAVDLLDNVFVLAISAFIIVYAIISLLVIIFNLPTSSVFEQKISEVLNFQRLSQSIQIGHNEEQVYEILLESSVNAVFATSAWLELYDEEGKIIKTYKSAIEDNTIIQVRKSIEDSKLKKYLDHKELGIVNPNKLTAALKDPDFASVLMFPLTIQERKIGLLVLLKDVSDGFNKEMADIINSFVNQACISIENFELLSEALENERYREELKIAKRVQKSLLPSKMARTDDFEMSAFSESADEVGGDYYDYYQIDEHKTAVIIGDVSGKGSSAAFHMSQMKGIFHSLVQLNLNPKDFLVRANKALSMCLEKTSFITGAFYTIDTNHQSITFSRAGHCPALYFDQNKKEARYFQNKGMGLGMVRNDSYENYIEINEIKYNAGDILILYTDGIVEAKNANGNEFGYDALQEVIQQNYEQSPDKIRDEIIKKLYAFSDTDDINDDYTLLIIKFS